MSEGARRPKHLPVLRTGETLRRDSPFFYRCGGCSSCCRNKAIPINPYEIARLAEHLGVSTTDVIARHTSMGGAILKPGAADAACPFLGPDGCGIHAARPLACRLYPLGRHVSPEGVESFAEVQPHPSSKGDWSGTGTVRDYLQSQGAEPYLEASDRYFALFRRMAEAAARLESEPERRGSSTLDVDNWLDIDAVLDHWCAERKRAVPVDLHDRIGLHVEVIDEMLRSMGV